MYHVQYTVYTVHYNCKPIELQTIGVSVATNDMHTYYTYFDMEQVKGLKKTEFFIDICIEMKQLTFGYFKIWSEKVIASLYYILY